eukprot:scaffold41144_cov71-Phaeocystis_antarctica.AAC.1
MTPAHSACAAWKSLWAPACSLVSLLAWVALGVEHLRRVAPLEQLLGGYAGWHARAQVVLEVGDGLALLRARVGHLDPGDNVTQQLRGFGRLAGLILLVELLAHPDTQLGAYGGVEFTKQLGIHLVDQLLRPHLAAHGLHHQLAWFSFGSEGRLVIGDACGVQQAHVAVGGLVPIVVDVGHLGRTCRVLDVVSPPQGEVGLVQ